MTVIPIWLTNFVFKESVTLYKIHNFTDFINFLMYGAHTLRILRSLRLRRKLLLIQDEVKRTLLNMLLTVLAMMLFGNTR